MDYRGRDAALPQKSESFLDTVSGGSGIDLVNYGSQNG
jgi:hypothetical protein